MVDILWGTAAFAATAVYASFFEWTLHRFLLHRPLGSFDYPFRTHTLTHHHIFNAFDGYHLKEEIHKDKVPFAWWNAPVLIGLHVPALYFLQKTAGFPVLWPGVAAMAAYYAAYETFHWVMHVPAGRWIEKTAAFRFLDRHHRLHHLFQYKNFNVVLPVADVLLGTFIGKREDAYKKRPQAEEQVAGKPALMDSMDSTEPALRSKETSAVEAGKP